MQRLNRAAHRNTRKAALTLIHLLVVLSMLLPTLVVTAAPGGANPEKSEAASRVSSEDEQETPAAKPTPTAPSAAEPSQAEEPSPSPLPQHLQQQNRAKQKNPHQAQPQPRHQAQMTHLTQAASGGTGGNVALESYSYQPETGVLSSKGGQALSYSAQVSCPEGSRSLPHAASAMGANTYSYDCSGNMTQRVIGGSTYNLAYDAENRLSAVSGAASATYVYDGDGVRVKSAAGGTTTVTIGSHFEWTGSSSTMKRYYEAGGSRIGMRQGSTLYWLVSESTISFPASVVGQMLLIILFQS